MCRSPLSSFYMWLELSLLGWSHFRWKTWFMSVMCFAVASVTAQRLLIISKSADHNSVFSRFLSKTRCPPQPCLPLSPCLLLRPPACRVPTCCGVYTVVTTHTTGRRCGSRCLEFLALVLEAWGVVFPEGGLWTRLHTQHKVYLSLSLSLSLSLQPVCQSNTHTKHTQTLIDNLWWSCCKQGKLIKIMSRLWLVSQGLWGGQLR